MPWEPAARAAGAEHQPLAAALPRVVQEGLGGQLGQGDALGGQGSRDVEQRSAVVDRVHRGGLHLFPELVQQRVVLGDEEPPAVVEELVGPERFQRRLDDAQAEQARGAGPDLAPVPGSRPQDRDGAAGLVEPAGLPPLLPGLTRELAQMLQQVPGTAAPAPPVVRQLRRPGRAHRLRDLLRRCPGQITVRARRDDRGGRGGRVHADEAAEAFLILAGHAPEISHRTRP